jgi:outer membrane protein assembly factor BamB
MMPLRRACLVVLACVGAVAGLAGCSSGPPVSMCGPPATGPAVAHAYALDVTTAGRVRWQVPVATPEFQPPLSPLAVGAVAVVAQGNALYGLRLADGHRVWSWAGSQDIAGMWPWQSLVVVLTETPSSSRPVLTGLDASTGQARWTLNLFRGVGGFYPTADGGLAIISEDTMLEVVGLSSGRVRWTRPPAPGPAQWAGAGAGAMDPAMAVAGGALLVAMNGRLTSYDEQTGRVRWADTLMSAQAASMARPGLQASGGLVYLTGVQGTLGPQVLGISAADGRVEWRFAPSNQSLNAYAPGLVSVITNSGGTWQDELDPATGRVRWQVASSNDATVTPAGIVTGPLGYAPNPGPDGTNQVSLRDTLTGQTRWISGLNGFPALPVFPDGPLLIVPAAGPDGSDQLAALRMSDGRRAWQVTIPEPAAAPLSAAPGGVLVYSGMVLHGC